MRARFEAEHNARLPAWASEDYRGQDVLSSISAHDIRGMVKQDQAVEDAKDTLYSMLHFSAMVDNMSLRHVAVGECYMVMTRLYCLEQSILVSHCRLSNAMSTSQPAILAGIVCLATLIHISHLRCRINPSSRPYCDLQGDLRRLIGRVDFSTHEDNKRLLLWALYTVQSVDTDFQAGLG